VHKRLRANGIFKIFPEERKLKYNGNELNCSESKGNKELANKRKTALFQ
jgi:hypothetical protein